MVAAYVYIRAVPVQQTTWCHTPNVHIPRFYCQVCFENYPSVEISVFNIGIYGLYGGFEICAV